MPPVTGKTVGNAALIAALAATAALIIAALYLGSWWLRADRVNRQVGITNSNTGVQTAWRDEALDLISTIELLPPDAAQQHALTRQACDLIGRLTPSYRRDDRLVAFNESECI
jgi:hypothetical protein